ncbi:MAG TPA: methyltransferase domain-containing protein [Ktedonobacterales bacterium]|nr:methyltransferase domain-containing protein [Ktedonobacterales bacterium]
MSETRNTNDDILILALDHTQLAMPRGMEEQARAFYGGALGLEELPKPPALAARGGVWFRCGEQQINLGVEEDFHPQRKGHPGLLVRDLAAVRVRLEAAGAPIIPDDLLPGYERFYTADPFGNRIECLRPLADATKPDSGESTKSEEIKARVREMFGESAEAYVASPGHAGGADLNRLVELAAPVLSDQALDVSTGGGHTALALAPHVAHMTASDLTPRMLAAARDFLTASGVTNASYVIADAENLPFLDASFDLVTVRIAPHHYASVTAAVHEMARVLRPGGRLVVIDNIAPEDTTLDALGNRWEKWRDPSHFRNYTASEWRTFLKDAGLDITDEETQRKTYDFASWTARMRMPADERAKLEADILAASPEAREYFAVTETDGHLVSWSADFLIARAIKAGVE